ncbi:MAG: sugar ABC transporter permease [Chloroflexi bacterium]|nr:sugar ABC transporter permease [Chloroflexota bacterium]
MTTWQRIRRSWIWYALLLAPFCLFLLFVIWPTINAFRLSLYRMEGRNEVFVGLDHYVRLLNDSVFIDAIGNTVLLGVAFLVIVLPLSLVLASLMNGIRHFSTPFKVIYFLPQVTSAVAIALVFNYIFQPDWGLLNAILRNLGVADVPLWLAEPRHSLTGSRAAVTILAVWMGLGYFVIVILAGLQTVPRDLYDAAAVDGAGPVQSWRHITLPGLRPILIFLIVTGIIDAMARFSDLWMLGGPGGAPARSLQSIVMFMYQTAFESGNLNLASAVAVIFFMIVLLITAVNYGLFIRRETTTT